MSELVIYEPKGRAREYAALATNIYRGCDHKCRYCYSPTVLRMTREDFTLSQVRRGYLKRLAVAAKHHQGLGTTERILLCFTCDPYQQLDIEVRATRRTIEILHDHGLAVQVLTKGGKRAFRDLDLFTEKDAFATTLTFTDDPRSRRWEPFAALPESRVEAIKVFYAAGIPTWVSLEPVLDPLDALTYIRQLHSIVDEFKIGKLNYMQPPEPIDWKRFANEAVELLESLGQKYTLKKDLADFL